MPINKEYVPIDNQPTIKPRTVTGIFTRYIAKTLPLAFDESMSYYECLCALLEYINTKVIPALDNNAAGLLELQEFYLELQNYVNDYFKNLDVQEEINNKLDAMVEAGTLDQIIEQYLNSSAVWGFDTVEDMANATNLINGSFARTLGYHYKNDGGKALYKIRTITNDDVIDNCTIIEMINDNTLIAELIEKNDLTPEMFGAYGDGVHDDHTAILNLIKYVDSIKTSIDSNNYSTLTIKFNNKTYLNNSTIIFSGDTTTANSLNIDGNGAFINGYGFKFTANAGWKLKIFRLNFADMTTAFEFETRNLEYGNFVFDSIEFVRVVNPFIMDRRSCIVEIKNSIFRTVKSIGEFTNVDRLYFHHNWVEPDSTLSGEDYKSMLKQNTGSEGSMFIYNNLFVPVGGTNCKELCWIEVNKHARIYNNRFGGENVNYHPLRVGAGFTANSWNSPHPYLSFDHNDEVSGATAIILESICANMLINYNQGYIGGQQILQWSDKVDATAQASIINKQNQMLNLVVSNNVGRNTVRNGDGSAISQDYIPTVPTNLYGLINRGLRNVNKNSGENAAYLKYIDTSSVDNEVTLTIANQPFDNINGTSLGGRFTNKNNFAILVWCGYGYKTNYSNNCSYILITFDFQNPNLVMKTNYIGGTIPITAKFSNDTDTIDITTLYEVKELTIKLVTDNTNKGIKGLRAQIFRPQNQLDCFI